MANESTRQTRKLNAREMFALGEYVRAEYVKAATSDVNFATKATEKLGFLVSPSSVATARDIFDIKSTVTEAREASRSAENGTRMSGAAYARLNEAVTRAAAAEKRVDELGEQVKKLSEDLAGIKANLGLA